MITLIICIKGNVCLQVADRKVSDRQIPFFIIVLLKMLEIGRYAETA